MVLDSPGSCFLKMLSGGRQGEDPEFYRRARAPGTPTRASELIQETQEHQEGQLRKTEGPSGCHGWGGPGVFGGLGDLAWLEGRGQQGLTVGALR